MSKVIHAPLDPLQAASLRAGESVLLSGILYTGRDAAHKRLCALIKAVSYTHLDVYKRQAISPSCAASCLRVGRL